MSLDDGTGLVECCKYVSETDSMNPVENIMIGHFVHVRGVLLVVNG
jgi:hypothetical protein